MNADVPDTLDAVFDDLWSRWVRGKADRKSAFHTPVVCSVDGDTPSPRLMVLRQVDRNASRFRFHTDRRSAKASQFGNGAKVSIIGYDPATRVQVTAWGFAAIEASGSDADAAWSASALSSRRCYLAEPGPGTLTGTPDSGLPAYLIERAPTLEESQSGRANFAILVCQIERFEWLKLTACGNRRARFERLAGDWQGTWLIP